MLKLTSFIWWQCHNLTKCFHQIRPSFLNCSSASWELNMVLCLLSNTFYWLLMLTFSFFPWLSHAWQSLPILNLKHVMNWLLICPSVKNVTEDEHAPFYDLYQLVFLKKKKCKECTLWIDVKILQKRNKSLPLPPPILSVLLFFLIDVDTI